MSVDARHPASSGSAPEGEESIVGAHADAVVGVEAERLREVPRPEWAHFAAASGNVFATREFVAAWRAWAGSPRIQLFRIRRASGEPAGLVALAHDRRGPLRLLRFAGHGPADLLGPVGAPGDADVLAAGLARALEQATGYDLFIGERLPGTHPWARSIRGVELGREGFPVARLDPGAGWEGYLAALSPRLRKQLRHDERALAARGSVALRLTETTDELDDDLETFLRLHRLRWQHGESSLLPMTPFLRSFLPVALERGWLRLAFLELDGRPIATRLDLRYGTIHGAVNGGWDPAFAREGVGTLIRARTLRLAIETGATEYRMLRGAEAYKYRFADDDDGVVTVARARTPVGAAALAAVRAARHHEGLRRLVRRLA